MQYRRVGNSGLKVSVLSFGSWITFGTQIDGGGAEDLLGTAYEAGVNFFDNAEAYAGGESEHIMGEAIANLGWKRNSYVISSKFFWGIDDTVNTKNTLNRKYLLDAVDGSLERLGLDYIDIIYCHRPDPETPIEETIWAMSDLVASGRVLYWGTSEFSAAELEELFTVAERHNLRKPIVEQPSYSLVHREKVDKEFLPLYEKYGLGLTTFSPLASGVLTGKYVQGAPAGSRGAITNFPWVDNDLKNPDTNAKIPALSAIAESLNCSTAQLAIAWCAANPHVSSVIMGASRVEQLKENLGAADVIDLLTDDVMARINALFSLT